MSYYRIEYEFHDEIDRGLPMVVEYTKAGHRLMLATFWTESAAAAAIAQLEGYPIADEDCECEFDHLCDQHYEIAYGKPREAA
jgi:hypothetical protein